MLKCEICGFKTTGSKYLVAHLKKKHSLSKQQYAEQYLNIPKCPICGKFVIVRSLDHKVRKNFRETCGNDLCKIELQKTRSKKTVLKKYGVENIAQLSQVKRKIKDTNLKRYGGTTSMSSEEVLKKYNHDEIQKKINNTKKKNNTFHTSKPEEEIFNILNKHFTIIRNYKSREYPFDCDFFIPKYNLYIELNLHWTHGGEAFLNTKKQKEKLKEWKSKTNSFYDAAIYTWTIRDVIKREIASDNQINFLEIFNIKDEKHLLRQINQVVFGLSTFNNSEKISQKVLKHQKHFYEKENQLWRNPLIRRKLIQNRIKYLNKNEYELTDLELLRGFKISGIYYGYSHFNYKLIQDFASKYNINIIYDPFGGWGHRLLGINNYPIKYIYNDLCYETYVGVQNIANEINNSNVILYNENAASFTPKEKFDSVFTCPPYYNKEIYKGIKKFKDYNEYKKLLENTFNNCKHANTIGIVIDIENANTVLEILTQLKYNSQIKYIKNGKMHFNQDKKSNEVLIIGNK